MLSDSFGLSDEALRNPHKCAEEAIGICERLRLGRAFDDPTTRVMTAILRAALKTERL